MSLTNGKVMGLVVAAAFALSCFASTIARAQTAPPPDTFKVDFYDFAQSSGFPDGSVYLTNTGTTGGNLCALIYVFDNSEEMSECCSCKESVDSERKLSINVDLTSNPVTGVLSTNGVIYIVSSTSCTPTKAVPTAGIRALSTHVTSTAALSTEEFQDATLSSSEELRLQGLCSSIQHVGSGKGICTCGTGS